METFIFAFGVLTTLLLLSITVVVVGVVKVLKLQSEIEAYKQRTYQIDKDAHDRMDRLIRDYDAIITGDRRELNQRIDDAYRYVDSRFDKFADKITKKQLLKD